MGNEETMREAAERIELEIVGEIISRVDHALCRLLLGIAVIRVAAGVAIEVAYRGGVEAVAARTGHDAGDRVGDPNCTRRHNRAGRGHQPAVGAGPLRPAVEFLLDRDIGKSLVEQGQAHIAVAYTNLTLP